MTDIGMIALSMLTEEQYQRVMQIHDEAQKAEAAERCRIEGHTIEYTPDDVEPACKSCGVSARVLYPPPPPEQQFIRLPRPLVEALIDADPCWIDHNGGCQAHGYVLTPGEICPQAELKEGLRRHKSSVGEAE